MRVEDVRALKVFLTPLAAEMDRAVWKGDNAGTLASVQKQCAGYGSLASKLLAKDDPINGKLSFVPGTDRLITDIYRGLKVARGRAEERWADVGASNAPFQICDMPADAPLQILCCKDLLNVEAQPGTAREITRFADWGLIRLIRDNHASQAGDGTTWRFQIPLADESGKTGNLNFEIKFDSPLPKLEDWPKQ
jgi:hypothetical protein